MTRILEQPVDRFPLAWPGGWPRTPANERKTAPFFTVGHRTTEHGTYRDKKAMTIASAVERLMREADRLRAEGPVLSTNIEVRLDGGLRSDRRPVGDDPGVALYFRHKGRPIVMACDRWTLVPGNIAAIAGHIEAIRAQDRYGVGRLEQALAGYQRLLTGRAPWWEVLGFPRPPVQWSLIEEARTRLLKVHHPDLPTGSLEKTTEINEAFQSAKDEFGR